MPYPGLNEQLSAALEGLDAELGEVVILDVQAGSDGLYIEHTIRGERRIVRVSHPRRGVVDDHWLANVRQVLTATA